MSRILRSWAWLFMCGFVLAGAGCGGGGGATLSENSNPDGLIVGTGYTLENTAPGVDSSGATCHLDMQVNHSASITLADIDSWSVTAPTGDRWTITAAQTSTGTSNSGTPYFSAKLYWSTNKYVLPLSGSWTVQLNLKDGRTPSMAGTFVEPDSTLSAIHSYLYTAEDWSATNNTYLAALKRFPTTGVTLSSDGNGTITSSGFAAANTAYLAAETRAYDFYLWLYDVNGTYIGYTTLAYNPSNHVASGLLDGNGEISLNAADVHWSGTATAVSAVKAVWVVYTDGGQYVPATTLRYHYRSVSPLIPVGLP